MGVHAARSSPIVGDGDVYGTGERVGDIAVMNGRVALAKNVEI
jgi:hypothetical protein